MIKLAAYFDKTPSELPILKNSLPYFGKFEDETEIFPMKKFYPLSYPERYETNSNIFALVYDDLVTL